MFNSTALSPLSNHECSLLLLTIFSKSCLLLTRGRQYLTPPLTCNLIGPKEVWHRRNQLILTCFSPKKSTLISVFFFLKILSLAPRWTHSHFVQRRGGTRVPKVFCVAKPAVSDRGRSRNNKAVKLEVNVKAAQLQRELMLSEMVWGVWKCCVSGPPGNLTAPSLALFLLRSG